MILRKKNSRNVIFAVAVMLAALGLQYAFWLQTNVIAPKLGVLAPVPSKQEAAALSFGDNQLYFRAQALSLQFMGDSWGRSTPLKDYDYKLLYQWLTFLDGFDAKSNILPSAAAYYYSRTQRISDVKYVLDYIEQRAIKDPEANWWWISQSIWLANSVLKDKPRAVRMASMLTKIKQDIPLWARQMEAFLREDLGETDKAADIMCDTLKNVKNLEKLPPHEIDFFVHFFEQRLKVWKGKENELMQYCYQRELDRSK